MRKLAQSVPGFELSGCFKLVFASYFCSIFIIDCGVDGCRIYKGADWYPFHLGRGIGWGSGGWVVPQAGPAQNFGMPSSNCFLPSCLAKQF